ncbi:Tigger transposable element-derived protein 6 [Dictyocoela muelleri]|nr:Tigger transposable element-derived protein 6 [Dictyocoela muelleri]
MTVLQTFLPKKSLVKSARNGIKKFKDKITVMLACNMTGSTKLKPVIIGKFENPRALKGFEKNYFCQYLHNKSAWMLTENFNWGFSILIMNSIINNRKFYFY